MKGWNERRKGHPFETVIDWMKLRNAAPFRIDDPFFLRSFVLFNAIDSRCSVSTWTIVRFFEKGAINAVNAFFLELDCRSNFTSFLYYIINPYDCLSIYQIQIWWIDLHSNNLDTKIRTKSCKIFHKFVRYHRTVLTSPSSKPSNADKVAIHEGNWISSRSNDWIVTPKPSRSLPGYLPLHRAKSLIRQIASRVSFDFDDRVNLAAIAAQSLARTPTTKLEGREGGWGWVGGW